MLRSLAYTAPSNWVLSAFSSAQLQRLSTRVHSVSLTHGQILHEEGDRIQYVYFLDQGMVSLVLNSLSGHSVEVGLVGCEGIVGTYGVAGAGRAFSQAVVQLNGHAWRMPLDIFQQEFQGNRILHTLALEHLELLHFQAAQTALCNRVHSVEERLCRWLLMARNSSQLDSLPCTHECIANMLGVRRSGITVAVQELQAQSLIHCTRGNIEIRDSAGLGQKACPCYEVLRRRFSQLYAASRQLRENSLIKTL